MLHAGRCMYACTTWLIWHECRLISATTAVTCPLTALLCMLSRLPSALQLIALLLVELPEESEAGGGQLPSPLRAMADVDGWDLHAVSSGRSCIYIYIYP